jgi:hypothetical protein
VAFRTLQLRRHPDCIFSELHSPAHLSPCLPFAVHLTVPTAKLGAEWIATPFSWGFFHPCFIPCFCPSVEHACEAYRRVPIIFVGTVVKLGSRETNPNTGSYSEQMQFAVGESFKGTSAERITVTRVHVRTSCTSTAPEFSEGGHYLVWAFPDEHGNPVVPDCTVTRRLDDAAQLISELRELRAGHGPTYIFGNIVRDRIFPNGVRQEDPPIILPCPLRRRK